MGGDAQSPQHTIVQPMYVSYTSLPTTNSTSKLNHNTNSFRINSNKHLNYSKNTITTTASSCNENTLSSSKYFDDSTATAERVFQKNPTHKLFHDSTSTVTMNSQNYNNNNTNFNSFLGQSSAPQYNYERPMVKYTKVGQNDETFVCRDNSQFLQNDGYEKHDCTPQKCSNSEDLKNLNFIDRFKRSGHSEYPDLSPDVIETYSMPFQPNISASPTPSRMSIRRNQDKSNLASLYDRIISAPTQFADSSSCTKDEVRRSISKDHINVSAINPENKDHRSRPRSYCNSASQNQNITLSNNNG